MGSCPSCPLPDEVEKASHSAILLWLDTLAINWRPIAGPGLVASALGYERSTPGAGSANVTGDVYWTLVSVAGRFRSSKANSAARFAKNVTNHEARVEDAVSGTPSALSGTENENVAPGPPGFGSAQRRP